TFAPILAGVGEMKPRQFTQYNLIGGIVWGAGLVAAGKVLGDHVPHIDHYLLPIVALIIVASVIPPAIEFRRHKKNPRPLGVADSEIATDDLDRILNPD